MIIVNFKKYVSGKDAVDLAKICKKVSDETQVQIIAAVQQNDLWNCQETGLECWTQKLELLDANLDGTLLNHSDYLLPWDELAIQTTRCTVVGIPFCVCVNSFQEAARASKFLPDYIAYEPRELIGNKEKSVSSEKPDVIQHLTSNIQVPVLIGAGIHSPEDIKIGLKLGAKGFLLATDVVKAVDPEKELRKLAEACRI
ncbi:triose-phosphate isomerase [Candidatus Amesbacteria bacterium]|nr:triose-phosphate isomerase [Candidatus Amesbacteria bacterium]